MNICPVTLPMMLDAREHRQTIQNRLLEEYKAPLVCLTMNIAGDIKDTPAIRFAFSYGLFCIRAVLGEPEHYETIDGPTGREAFFVYPKDASMIKNMTVRIEALPGIGRLFDIDVLDVNGEKLSRDTQRTCIVCGGPVSVCSRSRAHGLDKIQEATVKVLTEFAAPRIAEMARKALYDEVHLTPKPGLVDMANNGAHKDMDAMMFEKSANALEPYFERAVRIGVQNENCFWELNRLGLEAELIMSMETGGVNTHKGAIYSFLLLLGAIGVTLHRGGDLFECVARLAKADDRPRTDTSHGNDVLAKYGITGARGEAENGFPHGQMAYKALREKDAYHALLTLMANMPDTNVLYRGGEEALEFMRTKSARILAEDPEDPVASLDALDKEFIKRNISPGGCADMLAMALFLHQAEVLFNDEAI